MNQVTDPNIRARRITRTSYIGIGANILLASFKAAVGLLSNSVAIVLDAVNNLTDALSSVLTILGVKLARRARRRTCPALPGPRHFHQL